MRAHPIYLIGELITQLKDVKVPDNIDGNSSPRHAWLSGYVAALQALTDALTEKDKAA